MHNQTNQIIKVLKTYANNRKRDVDNNLESKELSSLLLEKYAVGMVDVVRVLGLKVNIDAICAEADRLCFEIDKNTIKNRELRYKNYSSLDLSKKRRSSQLKHIDIYAYEKNASGEFILEGEKYTLNSSDSCTLVQQLYDEKGIDLYDATLLYSIPIGKIKSYLQTGIEAPNKFAREIDKWEDLGATEIRFDLC